jgi:protein SCO1/2
MLCTLVLNGLVSAMRTLSLEPGKDYRVVAVSFNPREKPVLAARKKENYLRQFGRAGVETSWAFLTGDDASIAKLTDATGFRYIWDPELKEYAHASGILVLTPSGKISKYFYGVEYPPKDLRLALVEAGEGRLGGPTDHLLLFCYRYDPAVGRYTAATMNLLRAGGVATLAALFGFIGLMLRRERRARRQTSAPEPRPAVAPEARPRTSRTA